MASFYDKNRRTGSAVLAFFKCEGTIPISLIHPITRGELDLQ
jgi:hypothetical protein